MAKYVFDSNIFINLQRRQPLDVFPSLWVKIGELMDDGTIISSQEVYDEIMIGGDDLEKWAKENSVIRLELTVECHNEAARKLYEKSDFKVEGIRAKSMLVKGEVVDEYYMAKIL